MTEVPVNIIIGACNLLDTIKSEWGDQWSEWDQSIRDGLSKALSPAPASKPMKLHFDNDWLLKKIDEDGDYECGGGGPPASNGEAVAEKFRALVKSLEYEMMADGYIAQSSPEFKELCVAINEKEGE